MRVAAGMGAARCTRVKLSVQDLIKQKNVSENVLCMRGFVEW